MDSSFIVLGQKEEDVGTNLSMLVDLVMGAHRSSLQITPIFSMIEGHQGKVMKGQVILEICWREGGMK